jgi:hypothetical protein
MLPHPVGVGPDGALDDAPVDPRVKKLTRSVTFRQARKLLDRAIDCKTAAEVEHLVRRETHKIQGFGD